MGRKWDKTVLWASIAVAVVALIFGAAQYKQANQLRLRGEAARQRAVFSLISHVENMEGNLSKARVSSTPAQRSTFLTACWSHAQAAQENISLMGITTVDLSGMQKFVAQTGDYCMVLSQKLARGDTVTDSEWQELATREAAVKDLARALSETGMSAFSTRGPKAGIQLFISNLTNFGITSAGDDAWLRGFSEIDSLIQSVPSPAYDGPFSDRTLASRSLANPGPEISQEDAGNKAFEFLGSKDEYSSVRIENVGGTIPAFLVTGKREDGSEVSVSVGKAGGAVLWSMDQKMRGTAQLDVDAARTAAERFLREKGFESFIETGWRKPGRQAGRVVFTFVKTTGMIIDSKQVPVVLYPDMIKVEVALDTGDIIGFDATAYLTNHMPRQLKTPLVSMSEARNMLKPDLNVVGQPRLTVIPLVSAREIMAWEFQVTHQEDTYLIYINAMTGKEEMVLQMIKDETGSLTI